MSEWAVGGEAGIDLISDKKSGLGIFCDGNLPGEAEATHDLIGGVLDSRGAHSLHCHGRKADHHANNGHDDEKLDEGERGRGGFNHGVHRGHRGGGKGLAWRRGSAEMGNGKGRSLRWILFVALWFRVRLCFHSAGSWGSFLAMRWSRACSRLTSSRRRELKRAWGFGVCSLRRR